MHDVRPELHYQVGATPGLTEDPRCVRDERCQALIASLPEEARPYPIQGPDPKWRFFWRYGESLPAGTETKFPQLNADPVTPAAFPQWPEVMNAWAQQLFQSVTTCAEMCALGLDLPRDAFTRRARYGPHLLAPTASDLEKYGGKVGTVLAGFHYDLNLLTIHRRSRYPGLYIWPRNTGLKLPVRMPEGCLLVQAGRQMEMLTDGEILAGYHEVVVTEATRDAMARNRARGGEARPMWRISSTMFYHVASDEVLEPIQPRFSASSAYPPVLCGDYVQEQLRGIALKKH